MEKDTTCFFCDNYYHADPDTDRCKMDQKEVYFDTPKCNNFFRQKEQMDMEDAIHTETGSQSMREKWEPCRYCGIAPFMDSVELKPCASGYMGVEATVGKCRDDEVVGMVIYYRNTAAGYLDFEYCPFCGRPQTEEAWSKLEKQLKTVRQNGE